MVFAEDDFLESWPESEIPGVKVRQIMWPNAAQELITLINEAMAAARPPTYTTSTLKRPPWMTREVDEARAGIKHKLKRAKKSKSKSNWDVYHSELKKCKKLLSYQLKLAGRLKKRTAQ